MKQTPTHRIATCVHVMDQYSIITDPHFQFSLLIIRKTCVNSKYRWVTIYHMPLGIELQNPSSIRYHTFHQRLKLDKWERTPIITVHGGKCNVLGCKQRGLFFFFLVQHHLHDKNAWHWAECGKYLLNKWVNIKYKVLQPMRGTGVERYNRNRNSFLKQEALCEYKELKIKSSYVNFSFASKW